MSLLAHWPLSEAPGLNATTAYDIVGGGSGDHDGTYSLGSTGRLIPPGYDGYHVYADLNKGTVASIANDSDFILKSEMTIMFWFWPGDEGWIDNMIVASYGGIGATETKNYLWRLMGVSQRRIAFYWEYDARVPVTAYSTVDGLQQNGPIHIAAVRAKFDGGPELEVRFYANGQLINTDDNNGAGFEPASGGTSANCKLGCNSNGQTDEPTNYGSVRVYDSVESLSAIQSVYNAEKDFYTAVPMTIAPSNKVKEVQPGDQYFAKWSGRNAGRRNAGFIV